MADGRTCKKAVRNALIVIEEGIETAKELGWSIPTSKGRLIYPNKDRKLEYANR